jgi:hypothetical protein
LRTQGNKVPAFSKIPLQWRVVGKYLRLASPEADVELAFGNKILTQNSTCDPTEAEHSVIVYHTEVWVTSGRGD